MKKFKDTAIWLGEIILGCAIFSFGFDLFLAPNDLNTGGISGLAMVVLQFIKIGTVGSLTLLMNLPLFIIGGLKVGKKFFFGSLVGMAASSILLDVFARVPAPVTDPLLAALYGGVMCGLGLGIVFVTGASTGGSDIIVRLLKYRWQNVPIGTINMGFDLCVAILTGIAFRDMTRALYSGVALFITGKIIDAVVYRFDYSKVAIIISKEYAQIVRAIDENLQRGATYLHGEGTYTNQQTKVVLTAIKKQQLSDLKRVVVEIDPNAFIIVQDAHQVLGDGFSRYSKDSL